MKSNLLKLGLLVPLVTVILIFTTTVSCKRTKFPDAVQQIDSIFVISDSTESMLNSIDTAKVLSSRKLFAEHWKPIKEALESIDHVEKVKGDDLWNYITLYEAKDRSLKKLMNRYRKLKSLHLENLHQLKTLKESINNNYIPEDSIAYYILSESVAVAGVQRETRLYMPEMVKNLETLDSLHRFAPAAIAHYQKLSGKGNK